VPITSAELEANRDALPGNELHLVALADEAVVGVGFVTVEGDESEAWIGVLPASRRRGFGRALHEGLSAWARAAGLEQLEGRVDAAERTACLGRAAASGDRPRRGSPSISPTSPRSAAAGGRDRHLGRPELAP
jgi:GNAT superfamily N-acetyltransferase